jgi:heat shock protein HtpX
MGRFPRVFFFFKARGALPEVRRGAKPLAYVQAMVTLAGDASTEVRHLSRIDTQHGWEQGGKLRPAGYHSTGGNYLRTSILMAGLLALVVFLGGRFGGAQGMILWGSIGIVFNLVGWWFSDKIALALHRAKPVSREQLPRVYEMVEELTKKAGIPMPRVYVIPSPSPNAFATGRSPSHAAVAVTSGILELLQPHELRGVLAHEIAHVVNRDTLISTVTAIFAGLISAVGSMVRWGVMFGGFGGRSSDRGGFNLGDLAVAIVAPIVAMLIQLAVSRSREYGADTVGAQLAGDPNPLADALAKLDRGVQLRPYAHAGSATAHLFIVNPFTGRNMMKLLSTHPPIEERVARLRQMAV